MPCHIEYISGGLSGSGYASRYWDCCKESCSWTVYAGRGNEARQCDNNQKIISDISAKSVCYGGPASAYFSYFPFNVDGCTEIRFAFAAVPLAGPNICGRCFELSFTGEGKYETTLNHQKLKGKKLIVMTSNIVNDFLGEQFDIMKNIR